LLLLLFLVFLVPVAAYCLILALLNRRLHPVMLSGPWDAAGLLFAASGGLLFVGPAVMALLYHRTVNEGPLAGKGASSFGDLWASWWGIWLVYYLVLVAGSVALLWLRRGKTIIYNVDPEGLERTLAQLLDRLGLEWNRLGNRVFVSAGGAGRPAAAPYLHQFSNSPLALSAEAPAPAAPRPAGEAVFDIEPFTSLRHVTLHWRQHSGLVRAELEAELDRALAELPAPDNPAGTWFMGVASFLLALIFLGIFVIVLNAFFPPRR
jgi:hypothetical protein